MSDTDATPVTEIHPARSENDFDDIYGFRYRIYVEEMGRYRSIADHDAGKLIEADDERSHLYCARCDGAFAGTMRFTCGGDGGFTERHIAQYDLQPFLETVPQEHMVIGERFMIDPVHRGSDLLFRMFCVYMNFVNERRIQLIFGDCEPHLLNVYLGLGFRTYTNHNVNSPETGYLIPLVMIAEDLDYFRAIKSPLAKVLRDFGADARVPDGLDKLLEGGDAVMSERMLSRDRYWESVGKALMRFEDGRTTLFDDMSEEEVQACLAKSNTIKCARGDRIIKRDNVAQNMFVVLSGTLEVKDGDEVVAVLSKGDMFGEIAFFLDLPRTRDVYAATDDVTVMSLSESTLRSLIGSHSEPAAKLLLNVAKMMCFKLVQAG